MGFWHGILIGLFAGGVFGMIAMAVISIDKCSECKWGGRNGSI